MASEREVSDGSKKAIRAKIQRLEAELASLKQQLHEKHDLPCAGSRADNRVAKSLSAAALPTPSPFKNNSDQVVLDEQWLSSAVQFLIKQTQPGAVSELLGSVGDALSLSALGVWQWDPRTEEAQLLEQWYAADLTEAQHLGLQHNQWLAEVVRGDALGDRLLSQAQPLVFIANDSALTGVTSVPASDICPNTLIVPFCEGGSLRGLMSLQRKSTCGWHQQDINLLNLFLNWLLLFMQQQQQLRQLADRDVRFQYAMEATNDGLWDWNLRTNKIYFNRSYLRMLGYDYEDLPGNLATLTDYFLHPDDAVNVLLEYQIAQESHQESLHLQFRMLHRDGRMLWVSSKAKFFELDENGIAGRCVGINTDITEYIQSRAELLNAKAQADMASKTKSEFLARVSHEIRTPMNAIIGIGYLMHDTLLDEQQKSYLSSIGSAADSLLQIINQLLDFSKIESGRIILEHAHFDLEQQFEKISRLFEITALHKSVNIAYDLRADVPKFLRGDASRLSQIIGHLITNALQYSNTREVLIGVRKLNQNNKKVTLEFSVTDYGLGLSHAKLEKIKSQLLDDRLCTDTGKNIYGLGICNHLIHLMGGELNIESELNRGCKVSFSACFERSQLGEKTLRTQSRELNNIRVLIVDDNTIARTIIASTARSIHLQVDEADSPLEALEKIRQADYIGEPYHFLLLDYRMPKINGLQLTGLIKSDRNLKTKPQVFLISAYHRDEISSAEPNSILVDEFLSKPVSESRLFDAISQAIGREPFLQELSPAMNTRTDQEALLAQARVLVAEDNVVNQQVICGILKRKNIITVIACNGAEAVHCIEAASEPFDAILMDLEMPEMDGLEATSHIRLHSQQQDVPIIAVTAQAMRGDRERCLAAGMNAYLSKPVNPELLYTTLADILRLKKVTSGNSH